MQNLTVVSVDLGETVSLWSAHSEPACNELLLAFVNLARSTAGAARLCGAYGDALLLASSDPDVAVRALLDLAAAADAVPGFPLLRAGAACGAVEIVDEGHVGVAAALANRLRYLARPGQLLVTDDLAERVTSGAAARFADGPKLAMPGQRAFQVRALFDRRRPHLWTAVDPVCGMRVDRESPHTLFSQEGGKSVAFCSEECLRAFLSKVPPLRGGGWG